MAHLKIRAGCSGLYLTHLGLRGFPFLDVKLALTTPAFSFTGGLYLRF